MNARAQRSGAASHLLVASILLVAVAACFYPLTDSEFLLWDEETLLIQNRQYRELSTQSLAWMLSTFFYGHYQPLAWLSFALDFMLWGLSAPGFRWTSVALHALNALLVYRLTLRLLTISAGAGGKPEPGLDRSMTLGAAAAALFFAVHPLRAEPVAWLANRNGLLAAMFALLSLSVYLGLLRPGTTRRVPRYLLSLLLYALALASKASVMALPAVLLIIDVYPLRRIGRCTSRSRVLALILEKLPYLAISIPFAVLAVLAKREEGGLGAMTVHGWLERLSQVAYGLGFYLWKTVVPVGLSPLYLFGEQIDPTRPRYLFSAAALIGTLTLLALLRRRAPWLVAAWACYAVLLLPVSGLTQAGAQLVADRYAYLSCIPWAVLLGAALAVAFGGNGTAVPRPTGKILLGCTLVLALTTIGVLCHRQVQVWRDSVRLWTRVLEIEPDSHFAYQNRGRALQVRGELEAAIADYDRALMLKPAQALTYRSRGTARRESGDLAGAILDFEHAARLTPQSPQAWIDLGVTRRAAGEVDRAIADLNRAIELRPRLARAYQQRALAFEQSGDLPRALEDLDRAIHLAPNQHRVYRSRGRVREALGDAANAARDYARALELAPANWKPRAEVRQHLERMRSAGS